MRRLSEELHREFEIIHLESRKVIDENEFSVLLRKHETLGLSACELIVRGAAKVEQSCGGITTRLWDDPFEWTLEESFPDKNSVVIYLDEVAAVRKRAFDFIFTDADLAREVPAPEKLTTLFTVLVRSLISASKLLHLAGVVLRADSRHIEEFFE